MPGRTIRGGLLSILLLTAAPIFAQLPPKTVTITATRSIAPQADQFVFGVSVTSGTATTLDQITGALSGLGITSASLSGVDSSNATMLQWNFTLAVPISNLPATITLLTKLERSIGQNNSGLMLTFSVNGTQASQQLQQSQQSQACSNAGLISDATAQAQKLASAAGLTLGPIVKLTTAALVESPISGVFGAATVALVGYVVPVPNNYSAPLSCSLTVQFQLLP
jgi:hypothetical protein